MSDAQVFRHTSDGKMRVISVDLTKALAGDQANDVLLEPKDQVFIHKDLAKADPPAVTIQGEVARPGKYPLGEGMTASQLVRLAGGVKRSADSEDSDLTQYLQQNGEKRVGEQRKVDVAKAMIGCLIQTQLYGTAMSSQFPRSLAGMTWAQVSPLKEK